MEKIKREEKDRLKTIERERNLLETNRTNIIMEKKKDSIINEGIFSNYEDLKIFCKFIINNENNKINNIQ